MTLRLVLLVAVYVVGVWYLSRDPLV